MERTTDTDAAYEALTSPNNPNSVFQLESEEVTPAHMRHIRELKPEELTQAQLDEIRRCFGHCDPIELTDSGGGVWFHRFVESFEVKPGVGITVTYRVMPWVPAAQTATA
jgi:hypothetical protein